MNYVEGCIVQAAQAGDIDVLVHQTNCFNRWSSGLAPQIEKAFPDAKLADDHTKVGDPKKLGKAIEMCRTYAHSVIVMNVYGQYEWSNPDYRTTDYPALAKGLTKVAKRFDSYEHIGLPKIGCGVAGGDWDIVREIIESVFAHHQVTIYTLPTSK